MKSTFLSIFILSLSLNINAQTNSVQSLKSLDTISRGAFGGPKVSLINPVNKNAVMVGGQGALVLNSKFALGGFGQGMAGATQFDGHKYGYNHNLELSMGYGGIFLEYMPFRHKLFHPSLSLPVALGGASITNIESDTKISKTSLWSISPRLGIDFNINTNATVSLFAGYNFIKTHDSFMIANNDLSSWEIGLCVKLGSF